MFYPLPRIQRRRVQSKYIEKNFVDSSDQKCLLFDSEKGFKPKPGGQTEFWDHVSFKPAKNVGERFLLARGGRSAGKSYGIGAAFVCARAFFDPQAIGLVSANDYGQLEDSTLVALAQFCEDFNVPLSPVADSPKQTAKKIAAHRSCRIFNADVLVKAANRFEGSTVLSTQSGRGTQMRWAWLDEWAYAQEDAFETLLASMGRGRGTLEGLGIITSTTNRNNPYNWVYKLFDDPRRSDIQRELYRSFCLDTADNDNYDRKFVRSLEAKYTDELIEIELRGGYALIATGKLFNYWNRDRHIDGGISLDNNYPVILSLDFNNSPCTALAAQIEGDQIWILKEFYLVNAGGTFGLSNAIKEWLEENNIQRVIVTGDASGTARTANSAKSNWDIVHENLKQVRVSGFRVQYIYPKANPSLIDSTNSCNALLKLYRVFVQPDLYEFISDLESLCWKEGVKPPKIDKSDLARSHLGDCFRYLVQSIFPIRDDNLGANVTQISRYGQKRLS